ncbi:MAG: GYD domain-containing protein [Candidatus Eisenbacteria bacterium]|uniref:GYD domain-containing protein n=1 Tax=Eiseniibacteriota bacterium TaxID=2212470 RepID=A0A948W589_UNCEI|nr:GYD domain-containing protein [Candidatus Eisenbacteria bacterium]MBU1951165.1 GYD domain-containing protein [Candidatus Eisenbacteria bacterium]MBU2690144.1 GYD domain-containing protein [Candidatus Eisenbacteria bacterium]
MPRFILMTCLSAESLVDAKARKAMGKDWIKKVKEKCPDVKWVSHYALLGAYDFMDIYDAPDAETAHKVSLISLTEGAVSAESWQALPYDEFLDILDEVQK